MSGDYGGLHRVLKMTTCTLGAESMALSNQITATNFQWMRSLRKCRFNMSFGRGRNASLQTFFNESANTCHNSDRINVISISRLFGVTFFVC